MKLKASYVATLLFFVGLLGLYVGERLISAGSGRIAFSSLGILLVLAAIGLRAWRIVTTQGDRQTIEKQFLYFYGLGLGALVLYFVQSDLWTKVASSALSVSHPRFAVVLQVLWPAMMFICCLVVFMTELAYASMAEAQVVEKSRVLDAGRAGMGLGFALVFVFALAYVADARDMRWDVSYFRATKPGEATRKVVRALTEPLDVTYFYPPGNEVAEHIKEYLEDLSRESNLFRVHASDQALEPAKAQELEVTRNGTIVVHRDSNREQILVPVAIDAARGQLRSLDKDFQTRLLKVARATKTIYFTQGHGERVDTATPMDQRGNIRILKDILKKQNYEAQEISASQGLANAIPKDAGALFIIGPQKPFLPQEIATIKTYLANGGRALVALDPESGMTFSEIFDIYGVKFDTTFLANDQAFITQTGRPSDRTLLYSAEYSSHPAVTALGQLGARAPVVFLGAGSFEDLPNRSNELQVDNPVRAHRQTWRDANGNFEADQGEERRDYTVMFTVSKGADPKQSRLIALADADALSDVAINMTPANAYLAVDSTRWLMGDEAITGVTSSEVDQPIQHTRKQDVTWFYLTIFVAPAAVIVVGLLVTRGRGGKRKRAVTVSTPAEAA